MTIHQWERVAAVFEAAVVREPAERLRCVREACADDPALRNQVESMLAELDRPVVIDRPVSETIAELLNDEAAIAVGTQIGPYRVESLLGVGGMGEVYRASDTVLGRQVAIKVLPADLAADSERLARLKREARILASLNHPNIGAIHGLETLAGHAGPTSGLVLELVEGPTLAEKLHAGPLPVAEVLALARQIADALEAAHRQGIVHRDLKPGNIKVRNDGTVKVLDFGLATITEDAPVDDAAELTGGSDALAITTPAVTATGIIMGTAAYMAPEQAKSIPADKRSDVWAFGCILYEMLTGQRAFDGEGTTEVLDTVVRLEPNWHLLPSEVPQAVRTLMHGCLVKDRRHRVADISTAGFVLDRFASLDVRVGPTLAAAWHAPTPLWRRAIPPVVAAVVTGVAVGALMWVVTHPDAPRVTRLTVTPTGAAALALDLAARDLAIVPDGTRFVYKGVGAQQGGLQLFVQELDQLNPTPLVDEGNPRAPFVSPDGQWVGFIAAGVSAPELKKIAITGGPSVTLCSLDSLSSGATWGEDGSVIFATTNPLTGLQRVPSGGGTPVVLTTPDRARGEGDHLWPQFVPGRQAVLFTITSATGGTSASQIAVLDLRTGTQKILLSGGSQAQYTPSGHLVYAAAGTLMAIGFDVGRLEVNGAPAPAVSQQVTTLANGTAEFDVARNGTLVYVPAGSGISLNATRTLVWVDRQGREEAVRGAPARSYWHPRLSPDGSRLAFNIPEPGNGIWVWDFAREALTRLTFDSGLDMDPVWRPDGLRIIYNSQTGGFGSGVGQLFSRPADGTGDAERIGTVGLAPRLMFPSSVSPDGATLVTWTILGSSDLMQITLNDGVVRPLIQTPFVERNGEVSPDGRWLAYESNASGQFQIHVRPFPGVESGQWQVSAEGGAQPAWARGGHELFYLAPDSTLRSVRVERGTTWAAGTPTKVFDRPYRPGTGASGPSSRNYDVSADGQRFLMIKESGPDLMSAPASIVVVQNWFEELKRLVSTR